MALECPGDAKEGHTSRQAFFTEGMANAFLGTITSDVKFEIISCSRQVALSVLISHNIFGKVCCVRLLRVSAALGQRGDRQRLGFARASSGRKEMEQEAGFELWE